MNTGETRDYKNFKEKKSNSNIPLLNTIVAVVMFFIFILWVVASFLKGEFLFLKPFVILIEISLIPYIWGLLP